MTVSKQFPNQLTFLILPLILAVGSAWHLHEDDFFWQYQTGKEIVSHLQIPKVDHWSYTVEGGRFIQIEWLSTVIIYLTTTFLSATLKTLGLVFDFDQGLFAGAVLFRSILIFVFFYYFQKILKLNGSRFITYATLTCLFYVSVQHRLHLRPELFTWFTLLAVMFHFCPSTKSLTTDSRTSLRNLFLINLIAFNLHGGTAIFTLLFTTVLLITKTSMQDLFASKWLLLGIFFTPILTPEHFHLLNSIYTHFNYENSKYLTNTEWLSFSFAFFEVNRQGFNLATAYILLTFSSLFLWYLSFFEPITGKGRIRFWTNQVLILYAFMRIRAIPYALVWVFFDLQRNEVFQKTWSEILPNIKNIFRWVTFSCGLLLMFFQLHRYKDSIAFDLDISMFPMDTSRYLKVHPIQGNVFSPETVSTYFLYALPEKKDFLDARDVLFQSVKDEYSLMFSDPESIKHLSKKYNITAIVTQIPNIEVQSDGKIMNAVRMKYPESDWALTFIDLNFLVMLRRVPENQAIISEWEYRLIDPSLPPTSFTADTMRQPLFKTELEHCLHEASNPFYCKLLQLRLLNEAYDDGIDKEAFKLNSKEFSLNLRNTELKYRLPKSIYLRIIEKTSASKLSDSILERRIDQEIQTLISGPNN